MSIPEKIPILRIEDYHTHYLGKTSDGRRFWGYETFAYSPKFADIQEADTSRYRSDYVVLHLFDKKGNYLSSRSFSPGKGIAVGFELTEMLETWISELGRTKYCNIEIKPFSTVIDGFIFGLIPDDTNTSLELQPSSTISFLEPWDGEYYT